VKMIMKHLVGVALGSAGALLLTKALEAALGDETPNDLMLRAQVAAISALVLILVGGLIIAIMAALSKPGERFSNVKPVALIMAAPVGVALSVAASLLVSYVIAPLLTFGTPALVTVLGLLLVALGVWLSRGFWGWVFRTCRDYLQKLKSDPTG